MLHNTTCFSVRAVTELTHVKSFVYLGSPVFIHGSCTIITWSAFQMFLSAVFFHMCDHKRALENTVIIYLIFARFLLGIGPSSFARSTTIFSVIIMRSMFRKFIPRMCSQMFKQVTFPCTRVITQFTVIGFLTSMGSHMSS